MEQKLPYKGFVFMDSGAHGLYNEFIRSSKDRNPYEFYKSQEFWDYVDAYASFIKQNEEVIEVYANVDAIYHPVLTWKIQSYLEDKHNLSPLPVIHYGTDLKWLKRYLNKGYKYIALGGIGQGLSVKDYIPWANEAFNVICDNPKRLPSVKVHGFAITSHKLMIKYPWYSVDSSSWLKIGAYGNIIVPSKHDGKWEYIKKYYIFRTSIRPSGAAKASLTHTTPFIKKHVLEYLDYIGYTLGKSELKQVKKDYILKANEKWVEEGKQIEIIHEDGLCNNDRLRYEANALYFMNFAKALPEWPYPFINNKQQNTLL